MNFVSSFTSDARVPCPHISPHRRPKNASAGCGGLGELSANGRTRPSVSGWMCRCGSAVTLALGAACGSESSRIEAWLDGGLLVLAIEAAGLIVCFLCLRRSWVRRCLPWDAAMPVVQGGCLCVVHSTLYCLAKKRDASSMANGLVEPLSRAPHLPRVFVSCGPAASSDPPPCAPNTDRISKQTLPIPHHDHPKTPPTASSSPHTHPAQPLPKTQPSSPPRHTQTAHSPSPWHSTPQPRSKPPPPAP